MAVEGHRPTRGIANEIEPARQSAPEWANSLQILAVAHAAHKRDKDAADVWREVSR